MHDKEKKKDRGVAKHTPGAHTYRREVKSSHWRRIRDRWGNVRMIEVETKKGVIV